MSDSEKGSSDQKNVTEQKLMEASQTYAESFEEKRGPGLQRKLKTRHIAMIRSVHVRVRCLQSCSLTSPRTCSIGGVIGTGLFLGTAGSLQNGGPVGLLLGYTVVGTITYSVMISLGEMIAYLPIPGGHIALAERFVDPAFAFTMVSTRSCARRLLS